MWEAEPHHSVCHPVSLNSCSCLLTVILICTQHGASLEAVFILPPQSQTHRRLRTSYFSSKNPRTFAFDFQIVLMSSCFFPPSFQPCYTKPQECWTFRCPKEREEQAVKPHNPSRGVNSWQDVQTQGLALWSITQIILVKVIWYNYVLLCFCETGTQLSETGTPSLSLELEIINQRTWHVRRTQRTVNSKPTCLRFKVWGYTDFLAIKTNTYITFVSSAICKLLISNAVLHYQHLMSC